MGDLAYVKVSAKIKTEDGKIRASFRDNKKAHAWLTERVDKDGSYPKTRIYFENGRFKAKEGYRKSCEQNRMGGASSSRDPLRKGYLVKKTSLVTTMM